MSGDMERIMREIHVMFAKAEKAGSGEDTIVVDKKKVFALLENLNREVYDALDRYEESQVSREIALQKFKEETDAMVERASQSAEEIYAGSILYSDSTLKELEKEVERAREDIHKTWEEMDDRLAERLRFLEKNRRELREQLEQMEQSRIYLELIGKAKREEAQEAEEQKRLNRVERKRQKPMETEQEDETAFDVEDMALDDFDDFREDDFDLDAEYFAWKEEINGGTVSYTPDNKKSLKNIFKRVK